MAILTRMTVAGSLVLLALTGCGSGSDDAVPVDTTSTEYLSLNVFDPCREMPKEFLTEHEFYSEPEPNQNEIDTQVYLGCSYMSPDYLFAVQVTNGPVSSAGGMAPQKFEPTTVAGRTARIYATRYSTSFCTILIEIKGGSLSLTVTPHELRPACNTLMDLAEELVSLLPSDV